MAANTPSNREPIKPTTSNPARYETASSAHETAVKRHCNGKREGGPPDFDASAERSGLTNVATSRVLYQPFPFPMIMKPPDDRTKLSQDAPPSPPVSRPNYSGHYPPVYPVYPNGMLPPGYPAYPKGFAPPGYPAYPNEMPPNPSGRFPYPYEFLPASLEYNDAAPPGTYGFDGSDAGVDRDQATSAYLDWSEKRPALPSHSAWSPDGRGDMHSDQQADRLRIHRDYMATRNKRVAIATSLGTLTGSYMVRSEKITEGWSCYDMTSDITKYDGSALGVTAAFNFGIIEGAMLISNSREDLMDFVKMKEAEHEDSEDEELDYGTL
ncbi:Hypothetical protein D9617_25g062050 [Elsinoe fawcettii]|nr:Hypothetical protein D9617_25g062050 [Elsinoe fawcettii]